MKITLTLFFFSFLFINGKAQLNSDEEFMYRDKNNGTLTPWTKAEKREFVRHCVENMQGDENPKKFCKCSLSSLSKGLNYNTYIKSTPYVQGKMTALHWKKCK